MMIAAPPKYVVSQEIGYITGVGAQLRRYMFEHKPVAEVRFEVADQCLEGTVLR